MIKLMKYLKRSAGYIVLIIALLFLQAYCDLSLPNYTSNIINVGIQQNGIEDSVPEKIRKTSMDSLKLFMEEDDAKTVDGFYEEEGDDLVLKDKMNRQINSIEELDNSVKYELLTRLNSMKNHTKLCHGDYCPDNIIVTADAKGNIKEITAVDWVHATQGNASADIANTFLLLKLQFGDKSDIPEKYISAFCELTNTKRSYVNEWLPLVAAARLTKNKEEEKELLNQWINVVDFQ